MPKRVLLVDDNRFVRETTRGLFEAAGFVCNEAADGAKAIEKVALLTPDLILLDLWMPVMNGLETATRLRQMLPVVPIILFTLYPDTVLENDAQQAGITSIVPKEEAASKLLNRARTLLSG